MSIIVLINIVYFVSSYFAYYEFELKLMDRISAQPKFINLYQWVQFQISSVKLDLGLIMYFALSCTFGTNKENLDFLYFSLDLILILFSIGITLGLNYCVRINFYIQCRSDYRSRCKRCVQR